MLGDNAVQHGIQRAREKFAIGGKGISRSVVNRERAAAVARRKALGPEQQNVSPIVSVQGTKSSRGRPELPINAALAGEFVEEISKV